MGVIITAMELATLPWKDIGSTTLVIIVVIMIFTGRLIPRGTYRDMQEQRDMFRESWKESQARLNDYDQRLDANTDALAAVKFALEEVIRRGDQR